MTNGDRYLLIIVLSVVTWMLVRHWWHLRSYPQIACSRCDGNGWRRTRIFHWGSLQSRQVRGPCHKCGASPWSERSGGG